MFGGDSIAVYDDFSVCRRITAPRQNRASRIEQQGPFPGLFVYLVTVLHLGLNQLVAPPGVVGVGGLEVAVVPASVV